jgi:hypothetical protein
LWFAAAGKGLFIARRLAKDYRSPHRAKPVKYHAEYHSRVEQTLFAKKAPALAGLSEVAGQESNLRPPGYEPAASGSEPRRPDSYRRPRSRTRDFPRVSGAQMGTGGD